MTSLKTTDISLVSRTFDASDRPAPGAIVRLEVTLWNRPAEVSYWKEPSDAKAWLKSYYTGTDVRHTSIDWA
jgi:hypothetical protein